MQTILLATVWHYLFGILLFLISIFLIGLILLQRGRGGGLTGALGGAGGQSAFGSKTGDVFTRVTIGAATVWIIACLAADKMLVTSTGSVFGGGHSGSTVTSPKKEKSSGTGGATSGDKSGDKSSGGASSDTPTTGGGSAESPEAESGAGSTAPPADGAADGSGDGAAGKP